MCDAAFHRGGAIEISILLASHYSGHARMGAQPPLNHGVSVSETTEAEHFLADGQSILHQWSNTMIKNALALIGLWVVVSTAQEAVRRLRRPSEA